MEHGLRGHARAGGGNRHVVLQSSPAVVIGSMLLAANVLALILAAAMTFRAMGLRGFADSGPRRLGVKRVVVGLTTCAIVISVPLVLTFVQQIHRGKQAPMALAVTNETRAAVAERVRAEPGVQLLLIGRPGMPLDEDPIDVGIILSSDHPLPKAFGDELVKIVQEMMQDPERRVEVACVAASWARPDDAIDQEKTDMKKPASSTGDR